MIRWEAMLAAAAAGVVSGFLWAPTASAQAAIPGWSTSDGPTKVGIEHGIGTEGRTALCAHPPTAREARPPTAREARPPTAREARPQPVSPKLRSSNTFAGQDIKADRYRGKRIRISADVFAEHLAGFGLVGVRVYGPFGLLPCYLHPIENTKGWEHEPWDPNSSGWGGQCDVPKSAVGIQIYLDLNAAPGPAGRFCVTNVDLAVIGPTKGSDPAIASTPATFPFFDAAPLEPKNTDFKTQ